MITTGNFLPNKINLFLIRYARWFLAAEMDTTIFATVSILNNSKILHKLYLTFNVKNKINKHKYNFSPDSQHVIVPGIVTLKPRNDRQLSVTALRPSDDVPNFKNKIHT